MSNRTSPIPPSDEEVAARKLTEARYSLEALAVRERACRPAEQGRASRRRIFKFGPNSKLMSVPSDEPSTG